jgi:hypothetical protein
VYAVFDQCMQFYFLRKKERWFSSDGSLPAVLFDD